MRLLLLVSFVVCLLGPASLADEQVRRVQEELRKRNLYFGEVDGRKTGETSEAIRRYQERKGFTASGELSPEILQSLEIVRPKRPLTEWPDGPVLKSDSARQLAEADRKFLETVSAADPIPVAEPPADEPSAAAAATASPTAAAPRVPPDVTEKIRGFVEAYLDACETNRLEEEMSFYADKMSYFDHGKVDRAFVAKDVKRFYQRWPKRQYELLDFKLGKLDEKEADVTFRIDFRYQNGTKNVAGRSLNFFKVRRQGEAMQFVSMKEQRVRD